MPEGLNREQLIPVYFGNKEKLDYVSSLCDDVLQEG